MTIRKEKALNPSLYASLQQRFGSVKIQNRGLAAKLGQVQWAGGRICTTLLVPGEYYSVSCPRCSDTRHRLWINHTWGTRFDDGRLNLWSLHCYNDGCPGWGRRAQYDLWESLLQDNRLLEQPRILAGREFSPEDLQADWPGKVVRVDQLPRDHPANQYLRTRRFDPIRLGRFYNVHYCIEADRWVAQDRLIIPLYLRKVMVGWQARPTFETDWKLPGAPLKYCTMRGTPRSMFLYNGANALRYRTIAVVEGPFDVWGFGPMACATLGASLAEPQIRELATAAEAGSSILLAWDPEAMEQEPVKKILERLKPYNMRLATIRWPKGRDPGNLDRAFQRKLVAEQAAEQGIEVSWSRREGRAKEAHRGLGLRKKS